MSDTISRQGAIDVVDKCDAIYINNLPTMADKLKIRKALLDLPSAHPNIIHCRYCDKCQYDTLFDKYWCNGREVREDFFCGDAVRRENR